MSASTKFLKKGGLKYDPKKALMENKGNVSTKNIEKKRIFKKSKEDQSEDEEGSGEEQSGYASQGGTFGKLSRKSFIQQENSPKHSNKSVLPISLIQAFYKEQQKVQRFLRS